MNEIEKYNMLEKDIRRLAAYSSTDRYKRSNKKPEGKLLKNLKQLEIGLSF